MKEVRPPKRPLIFYYCVAMLILLLFNFLAMPWMARQQIQEVDYGTFMDMAENQDLGQVEIQEQENQIVFTNKDETAVYSTGMIPDPDLKQMLKDSGAEFSGQVIQQTDPILSFLLTWILPIVIFVALGQYLSRRMMKNMGGPNAMAFGKSNAKVYVCLLYTSYSKRMEELLRDRLPRLMHGEEDPQEERAEAAALFAEYAIDFAAQGVRSALLAALAAMDQQMNCEEQQGKEHPV